MRNPRVSIEQQLTSLPATQVRYAAVRRQTAAHAGEKELQVNDILQSPCVVWQDLTTCTF